MSDLTETIIGIDSGASGAIAVISFDELRFQKLSATEREIVTFLRGWPPPVFAFLERAQAYPGAGVSGMFSYGTNYGFLRGALVALGIAFEEVSPAKWQRVMRCESKGDKRVTKSRAENLFPTVAITHANADAFLIAEYGRRLRRGK